MSRRNAVTSVPRRCRRIDRHLDRKLSPFARGTASSGGAPGRRPAGAVALQDAVENLVQAGGMMARGSARHDRACLDAERRFRLRVPFDDVPVAVDGQHGIERRGDQLFEP